KEGHQAIPQVLVHRPLVAVYCLSHEPQHLVHHLVHHLGVHLLCQLRGVSHISKQYRHLLALPFQGTARGENLLSQVPGGIRCWGGKTGCRSWRLRQIAATRITETAPRWIHLAACRAYCFELGATGVTEPCSRRIRMLTLWTVHGVPPPCRHGYLHPGVHLTRRPDGTLRQDRGVY